MLNAKNTLVIAPHPDDETLGAGGTLLRLKEAGSAIHWLLVTSAEGAGYPQDYVARQRQQIEAVRQAYPFDSFQSLGIPASSLYRTDFPVLVDRLRQIIAEIGAETIIVPHIGDVHDDHAVVHRGAIAASKTFRMKKLGVRRLLAMEILSETDAAAPDNRFVPSVVVDISRQLERKLRILELYATELQGENGPRTTSAIAAQARLHGATCSVSAAERFMLLREFIA